APGSGAGAHGEGRGRGCEIRARRIPPGEGRPGGRDRDRVSRVLRWNDSHQTKRSGAARSELRRVRCVVRALQEKRRALTEGPRRISGIGSSTEGVMSAVIVGNASRRDFLGKSL